MQLPYKRILGVLISAGLTAEAGASGAGGAMYVPGRVEQATHLRAVPGHADCDGCRRSGLAGVDHATPAPCTAEGGCYPNRQTFGWAPTRWRTWPGVDYGGPKPERADPADEGRVVIEPPAPEDEDQQAPPAIDDTEIPAGPDEGPDEVPSPGAVIAPPPLELPPLPRPGFGRPPAAAPAEAPADGPPALPFGSLPSAEPIEAATPARRAPTTRPVAAPKRAVDGPPALPAGLTRSNPARLLRRLPVVAGLRARLDTAVRTVSAEEPLR